MMKKYLRSYFRYLIFTLVVVRIFLACTAKEEKNNVHLLSEGETDSIARIWLVNADKCMDMEHYDSAQWWLNQIHAKIPYKRISSANYLLLTRQAEVYYYTNLHQLGLQESFRALEMAKALQDSVLQADSHNFLGLFFVNMDSIQQGFFHFNQAIRLAKQPVNTNSYPSLSDPHHIYGNRAELYFKKGSYDSALIDYHLSVAMAEEINESRGVAVAHYGMGEVWEALYKPDSALYYFQVSEKESADSKDVDIQLQAFAGLASTLFKIGNATESEKALIKGMNLLEMNPDINPYYSLRFLRDAVRIVEELGAQSLLIRLMRTKSKIETVNIGTGNTQMQTILKAGLENEQRISGLEISDAQQKQNLANTRLGLALAGLLIFVIAFFVYRNFLTQRLEVSRIRQKISQDLHDDIGASLSSMHIYATLADQSMKEKPEKAKEMLQKITVQSADLMANMNDIVWSMKRADGNNASFSLKMKSYASAFLSENGIRFSFQYPENLDELITGMAARKNLLLIGKESMNNVAKHSGASEVRIDIRIEEKMLVFEIEDNGKGLPENAEQKGNGLENIKQRIKEIHGKYEILSTEKGTMVRVSCPLYAVRQN